MSAPVLHLDRPGRFAPHLMVLATIVGLVGAVLQAAPRMVAALVLVVGLAGLKSPGAARGLVALTVALALGGWVWGTARTRSVEPLPLPHPVSIDATATVQETPRRGTAGAWRAIVRVDGGPGAGVRVFTTGFGSPPLLGDRITLRGRLRDAVRPRDPDWWRRYLARKGVSARLDIADGWSLVGRRQGVAGARDTVARAMAHSITDRVDGDAGALVQGIVLGGSEGLRRETNDAVRASGLSHLIAVSGQNVAVVVLVTTLMLRTVGAGRIVAIGVASLAVVAYCGLCESGPSVWRAAVAALVALAAHALNRARDRWYVFLVALAVLLAYRPGDIADPGLQLSFAAVAGILALHGPLTEAAAGWLPDRVAELAAVSMAASLATAPVLVWNFQVFPVVGVVANLVAVPLASVVLVLGLAGAVMAPVLPPAAAVLLWAAGLGATGILLVARIAASLPGATIGAPAWAAVAFALPILVLRWVSRRRSCAAG